MCGPPPDDDSNERKCVYIVNMEERNKKAWATILLVNTLVCVFGVVGEAVGEVTDGERARRERVTVSVDRTALKGKNTEMTAINSEYYSLYTVLFSPSENLPILF